MQLTIKKWGNSLATRIPKSVVESVGLHVNQEVEIEAVNVTTGPKLTHPPMIN